MNRNMSTAQYIIAVVGILAMIVGFLAIAGLLHP